MFRFSQAQKLLSSVSLAYKIASTACVCPANKAARRGVVKLLNSLRFAFVSVVSALLRSLFSNC